jgi:hypothetical protein
VNTLNHGDLKYWVWLIKTYGEENLRKLIETIPLIKFFLVLKNLNIHLEVLKSKQKELFNKLSNFSDFYLARGTGLAL